MKVNKNLWADCKCALKKKKNFHNSQSIIFAFYNIPRSVFGADKTALNFSNLAASRSGTWGCPIRKGVILGGCQWLLSRTPTPGPAPNEVAEGTAVRWPPERSNTTSKEKIQRYF